VLTTLALCAFFLAEGATALIGARVLQKDPDVQRARPRSRTSTIFALNRHDPAVILRRNIFKSELGDLTIAPVEGGAELVDGELVLEDGETVNRCVSSMRLTGTAVVPGDFERSLAVIVGADRKAVLYQGAATVEDSRIRAIHSDSVLLQSGAGGLCRLAMFDGVEPVGRFQLRQGGDTRPAEKKTEDERRRLKARSNRNAGLTEEELAQGIEKVNDTNYNIQRTLLNKVLDNAGKLIGIAAVAPKMEGGKSIGMEVRGIRPGTLLTKLGIKNSDVLESVNGQPLSGPDDALGAYTTLRTADKFTLSVQRGGKSVGITYNVD